MSTFDKNVHRWSMVAGIVEAPGVNEDDIGAVGFENRYRRPTITTESTFYGITRVGGFCVVLWFTRQF